MPRYEVVYPRGVGFRLSPDLADKADVKGAKPGEVLEGELVANDAWLELNTGEGLFLPVFAPDGSPLLRLVGEPSGEARRRFMPWQDAEDPSGGRSTPTASAPSRPGSGARLGGGGARGGAFAGRDALDELGAAQGGLGGGGGGRTDELAALDKKYDKKYGGGRRPVPMGGGRPAATPPGSGGSGGRGPAARSGYGAAQQPRAPPPAGSASPFGQMGTSHEAHTAYMHEFRDALEEMGMDTRDDPFLNAYAPVGGPGHDAVRGPLADGSRPRSGSRSGSRSGLRSGGAAALAGAGAGAAGGSGPSRPGSRASASGGSAGGAAGAGGAPNAALALCGSMVVSRSAASGTQGQWQEGPKNAIVPVKEWISVKHGKEVKSTCKSGRVIDVSDRNVLCMSLLGEKAVLGSADHGLKEINVRAGQQMRHLYTQRFGHSEWVTTVSHCPDGRVVSGAQDSKLCLWNATGVSCVDMTGHMGAISRVRVDGAGKLAISSSYDRTLSVWDLRSKRSLASCTGHGAPVMDFVWWEHIVASGDRSGLVKAWDTNHAQCIGTLKGHKGHITAMLAVPDGDGVPTIVTGAQDGHIRVWDLRQKINTFNMACHPGGAVNDLGITVRRDNPLMVSTGADGRLLVLEPRAGYRPVHELSGLTEDFLYSLLVLDSVAFVGDGRGQVSCIDLQDGQKRYSLDAGENAIRCLAASTSSLICAGDDGNAVIFDF